MLRKKMLKIDLNRIVNIYSRLFLIMNEENILCFNY